MEINRKYSHLLSPVKMNSLLLKNRIIATPTRDPDLRAKGGAAVVMIGSIAVDCDKSFWKKESVYPFAKYEREKQKAYINQIHYYGSKAFAQMFHAGMFCDVPEGDFAWGPSDTYLEKEHRVIKALDEEEMQVICDAYARTAKEAKDFGYDGLFMHFAHGWLASSFLSPHYNKRTDEYGGSIENRARFPLRILKAVREAVGPAFPIDMRVNDNDRLEYDDTIEFNDVIEFCKMAEEYVDAIQLSCGHDMDRDGNVWMASTNLLPPMINVDYAAELKKHCKKALVYAVGAIQTVDQAEQILAEGKVDLVAMGRELLADPELPNKVIEDRVEDIVPCLRCNYCYHISTNRSNIGCSVNPTIFRPVPQDLMHTDSPKNVVVIGAGPAGLKAAITADQVGHNVTLIEKENEVGGLLRYISKEHYKTEIKRYLDYLKTQLKKSNVKVMLNTKADKELVENLKPDRVIVAIGGELITPRIEGVDGKNVLDCLTAIERPELIGGKVAVIGGGVVGIEVALGLAKEEGKDVTVIEMTDDIASTANMLYKVAINQELRHITDRLHVLTGTKCMKISDTGVEVEKDGEAFTVEADTVITATGIRPKKDEAFTFYGITPYTDTVGDVNAPRIIMEATYEGYAAGNKD
ncbi:MAG: FAD-dependent oxidoreductase [Erysipelotrichaceae bacterium]|nr:FAD-dependent oxidoreductase [Erysipelotrichaceae bacterium]